MRILSSKSLITVLIVSTCFPFSAAFAQGKAASQAQGPGGTGGGHWIESGFRAKAEEIFSAIDDMSDEGKKLLRFDPVELLTNLAVPGRFRPKCVEEGSVTQKFLRDRNNIAYVGAEGAQVNEISLDCSKENEAKWKELFKSEDEGDHLLFIHEGLRNNNINSESENDYRTSGSYLAARKVNGINVIREIKTMVTSGTTNDCVPVVHIFEGKGTRGTGTSAMVQFVQSNRIMAVYNLAEHGRYYNSTSVRTNMLMPNSKLSMWVYNTAKMLKCSFTSGIVAEQQK